MLTIDDPGIRNLAAHLAGEAGACPVEFLRQLLRRKSRYMHDAVRAAESRWIPDPLCLGAHVPTWEAGLGFGARFLEVAATRNRAEDVKFCSCVALPAALEDPEIEGLLAEVAAVLEVAPMHALRMLLRAEADLVQRVERDLEWLEQNIWSRLPPDLRGAAIRKEERETLLGYGPAGY